jgi:glutamyl-tRNA(Gln) amidotransferase subunit D
MYSEKVEKMFRDKGIFIGDRIRVRSGSAEFEGDLMPRPETGDTSIIVLKLANGYNLGISSHGAEVSLLEKGSGAANFPSAQAKHDPKLRNISLIYTGGTIGSKVDYKTGGVYMLTKPEELLYEVPEIASIANVDVNNLMSVASEDLSYKDWQSIAEAVRESAEKGASGIVITHGTDTMHYTSAALSFMLQDISVPVILVGAQRSSDRGSSDAFINLICAARVAAYGKPAGVYICMHASSSDDRCMLIRGTKARKMHTSRRDAFRPVNDKPIAYVSYTGAIEWLTDGAKTAELKMELHLQTKFEPLVALVKAHPNSDPEIIDFYMKKGYKGLIIEGTGLGHLPTATADGKFSWIPHVKKAVEKGAIIGITSQCLYGRTNNKVYRNLRLLADAGAVYCEDMTPETAYVKLGWLLGNYDNETAKDLLGKNLAGEIKPRSSYDEFLV